MVIAPYGHRSVWLRSMGPHVYVNICGGEEAVTPPVGKTIPVGNDGASGFVFRTMKGLRLRVEPSP